MALLLATTTATAAQGVPASALHLFPLVPSWSLTLNNPLTSPPAMVGTSGYFPIQGDRLAAYDLEHGRLLWLVSARPVSQPAVGDGLVFVVEPAALTAFSEATGSVVWRVPMKEPLAVPLVWDNGWLIGATAAGSILAFRATDGDLLWRQDIDGGVHARPALAADRIYVPADDGRVIAMRVDTGARVWDRRIGGQPNDVLALDERVYVGSTDNYFYAIEAATGAIAWRWPTGADVVGLPIADDRRVYFVSKDNVARALDLRNGAQRWKRALTLRPTRGLVRAGDALFASGLAQNAPAYWMKDGTPAGDVPGGGELAAAPHVVLGALLPTLVLVTRSLADGTIVRALTRSFEPAIAPVAPLPNPIRPAPPTAPPTDSLR